MNFKDKRTRRITAACASAAVIVAGGVTVGATFASATGSPLADDRQRLQHARPRPDAAGQQADADHGRGARCCGDVHRDHSRSGHGRARQGHDVRAVETALNALSNVTAAGGVKVTDGGGGVDFQTSGHQFVVTFNVPGARAAITVADTHAGNANVAVAQTITGSLNLPAAKLGDATFGTKVTSTPVGKLTLSFDSYTAPTGVTPTGTPALFYNHSQASNTNAGGGPQNTWVALFTPASATAVSTTLATSAADATTRSSRPTCRARTIPLRGRQQHGGHGRRRRLADGDHDGPRRRGRHGRDLGRLVAHRGRVQVHPGHRCFRHGHCAVQRGQHERHPWGQLRNRAPRHRPREDRRSAVRRQPDRRRHPGQRRRRLPHRDGGHGDLDGRDAHAPRGRDRAHRHAVGHREVRPQR